MIVVVDELHRSDLRTCIIMVFPSFLEFNNYSTLNNEHNLEDQCIQLRSQQTATFNDYN